MFNSQEEIKYISQNVKLFLCQFFHVSPEGGFTGAGESVCLCVELGHGAQRSDNFINKFYTKMPTKG